MWLFIASLMSLFVFLSSSVQDKQPYRSYGDTLSMRIFTQGDYSVRLIRQAIADDMSNATLQLTNRQQNRDIVLWEDTTLFCRDLSLTFSDFNGDGVKDLLVFRDTMFRSELWHYLYIVNDSLRTLTRINLFEYLYNPVYDSTNNIIESWTKRGIHRFHRINGNHELFDLGHPVTYSGFHRVDSVKRANAVALILLENRQTRDTTLKSTPIFGDSKKAKRKKRKGL